MGLSSSIRDGIAVRLRRLRILIGLRIDVRLRRLRIYVAFPGS